MAVRNRRRGTTHTENEPNHKPRKQANQKPNRTNKPNQETTNQPTPTNQQPPTQTNDPTSRRPKMYGIAESANRQSLSPSPNGRASTLCETIKNRRENPARPPTWNERSAEQAGRQEPSTATRPQNKNNRPARTSQTTSRRLGHCRDTCGRASNCQRVRRGPIVEGSRPSNRQQRNQEPANRQQRKRSRRTRNQQTTKGPPYCCQHSEYLPGNRIQKVRRLSEQPVTYLSNNAGDVRPRICMTVYIPDSLTMTSCYP